MNFVAQVEEYLRDLGSEARKKHPGVKEASERAILALRSLQTQYVAAVRSAASSSNNRYGGKHQSAMGGSSKGSNDGTTTHPSTEIFRSQDVLRPFLLACNYPDANAKLLTIGLNAIQLLLSGNAVCPDDSTHIVRVLVIQASVSASLHGASYPTSINNSNSILLATGGGGDSSPTRTTSLAGSMMNAVGLSSYSSVSSVASPRSLKEDEAICMKVLQTLTMVVATKDMVLGEEVVAQCLMVCLTLIGAGGGFSHQQQASVSTKSGRPTVLGKKSSISADKHGTRVKRAALGTLKQMLSLVFDRALSELIEANRINGTSSNEENEQQSSKNTLDSSASAKIKLSTRNAAAGAFDDLCILAEHPSEYLDLPGSPKSRQAAARRKEMSGPFSIGMLASSFGGGGSSKQNLQYIQMPPRPTCFELINMILDQTPSLFANVSKEDSHESLRRHSSGGKEQTDEAVRPILSPLRRQNTVGSEKTSHLRDKSNDFPLFLRRRVCPLVTTTLLSEFASQNGTPRHDVSKAIEYFGTVPTEESNMNFTLLVRCNELASTIIQKFGKVGDLSGECHVLLASLVRYISATTEGYHDAADGFEDGFVYTAYHGFLDGADKEMNDDRGAISPNGSFSSVNAKSSGSEKEPKGIHSSIKIPHLVSNTLLWRAALAMETFLKFIRMPSLMIYFHAVYGNFNSELPLIAHLVQSMSNFAVVASSNENNILAVVYCLNSIRRSGTHRATSPILISYESKVGAKAREYAKFFDDWDISSETTKNQGGQNAPSVGGSGEYATLASLDFVENVPACNEGETIWLAFQCILSFVSSTNVLVIAATDKLSSSHHSTSSNIDEQSSVRDVADDLDLVASLFDTTFAPCLALLQHVFRRFCGSTYILECALQGYQQLTSSSLLLLPHNKERGSFQRRALVTTLCRLAFSPHQGFSDSSTSTHLLNQQVLALITLLRILHNEANHLEDAWPVVMRTLEQMSHQAVASIKLSDRVYIESEAIAQAYTRIPQFTTSLASRALQCLTTCLVQLSNAAAKGQSKIDLFEEEEEDSDCEMFESEENKPSRQSASPKNLFGMAGRALGVGTSKTLGSGTSNGNSGGGNASSPSECIEEISVRTDQTRAPLSKTYTSALYGKAAAHLSTVNSTTGTSVMNAKIDLPSHISFSLVLLVQMCIANHARFDMFGFELVKHLSSLVTECEDEVVRLYSMNALAHIVSLRFSLASTSQSSFTRTNQVEPSGDSIDYLLTVEEDEKTTAQDVDQKSSDEGEQSTALRNDEIWQVELISPLCRHLQTTDIPEGAECGLTSLYTILENEGHGMEGSCWPIVIRGIASCSGDLTDRSNEAWSLCGVRAFRCLKLIVDDFLDTLSEHDDPAVGQNARHALLDCCASFGSSRHDINTSLTAMGMLWTIADHHNDISSLDRVFDKLTYLSSDTRTEVRNCAVNTLFSCIAGVGNKFVSEQWKKYFSTTIFCVLENVSSHRGNDSTKEASTPADTKQSISRQASELNVHHSRDSVEKQWATTQILTMRGMERLLRQFFVQLLYTTIMKGEGESEQYDLWFSDAWQSILDNALECASYSGGRDNLEQQYAGIDLLILCCQLASRGGMEAAANPVRVTTNMQVVNGALREVGPSLSQSESPTKLPSSATSETGNQFIIEHRYDMFLVAFEKLEVLLSTFNKNSKENNHSERRHFDAGAAKFQVLNRITVGLANLYTACKNEEFSNTGENKDDDIEDRFVQLVRECAIQSSMNANSRFLNQSQRGCLELLVKMSANESWRAFENLAILGGVSFFFKRSTRNRKLASSGVQDEESMIALEVEAAKLVADAFEKDDVPDLVKASVLSKVLGIFLRQNEGADSHAVEDLDKEENTELACYDLLVPVMRGGLRASRRLETQSNEASFAGDDDDNDISEALRETVWARVLSTLSFLLNHPNGEVPDTTAILAILKSVSDEAPSSLSSELGKVFMDNTIYYEELVRGTAAATTVANVSCRNDYGKNRGDLMILLKACLSGACCCDPTNTLLLKFLLRSLQQALSMVTPPSEITVTVESPSSSSSLATGERLRDNENAYIEKELALASCESLAEASTRSNDGTIELVLHLFGLLCKLVSSEDLSLSRRAASVLGSFDINGVIDNYRNKVAKSQASLSAAEEKIRELQGGPQGH